MGVGEYEAQQQKLGTGAQPAVGYPASTGPVNTGYTPPVPPKGVPFQQNPQAYHEEYARPPLQTFQYPSQPLPHSVVVTQQPASSGLAEGCCLGCLCALCCCCCL